MLKVLSKGIHMWNMKALSLLVGNLWPRLKFFKSRPNFKAFSNDTIGECDFFQSSLNGIYLHLFGHHNSYFTPSKEGMTYQYYISSTCGSASSGLSYPKASSDGKPSSSIRGVISCIMKFQWLSSLPHLHCNISTRNERIEIVMPI